MGRGKTIASSNEGREVGTLYCHRLVDDLCRQNQSALIRHKGDPRWVVYGAIIIGTTLGDIPSPAAIVDYDEYQVVTPPI